MLVQLQVGFSAGAFFLKGYTDGWSIRSSQDALKWISILKGKGTTLVPVLILGRIPFRHSGYSLAEL